MIKTVTLTANSELAVDITGSHCKVKNRGSSTVYASRLPGISAGADEVIAVDSGTADVLRNVGQYGVKNGTYSCTGKLYLLSDTDCMVEIQTADDLNFFKSGGSEGGGDIATTAIYIYMTQAEYEALTEYEPDKLYWVVYPISGSYLVWRNGKAIGGSGATDYVSSYNISTLTRNSNYSTSIAFAYVPYTLHQGSTKIGPSPYPCLKYVDFSNAVTEIGEYAFFHCYKLESIYIPNHILTIKYTGFSESRIKTITINKPQGSISGSPWGAEEAIVVWTG